MQAKLTHLEREQRKWERESALRRQPNISVPSLLTCPCGTRYAPGPTYDGSQPNLCGSCRRTNPVIAPSPANTPHRNEVAGPTSEAEASETTSDAFRTVRSQNADSLPASPNTQERSNSGA